MGHPHIACSAALFCVLPSYDQASENRLTKGFKGPFANLSAHSRVGMGLMLYKAFCLVYHGSHPNNREHISYKMTLPRVLCLKMY